MATELPKQYNPKEAQDRWQETWIARGYYHSEPDASRKPYTIVIPPPNVTGALHMGHALNNTLQDVLIRWRRMQGFNTLWIPGTDHAGIATQAVVERRLKEEEGKTRHEIGREELVRRIWAWKDQYEKRILSQLRSLGASCDWERNRFTLDPICARAVRETFFKMFRDGYIYRGKRLVNWDAALQTAVADDEVENLEQKGKFYYFRYPVLKTSLKDAPEFVLIATTRPETMLGDTAVAVHPDPARELTRREEKLRAELSKVGEKDRKEIEARLKKLASRREEMLPLLEQLAALAKAGTTLELPLIGRKIPLIADEYADPEKGTGAVKITPAHDHNDYQVWTRHNKVIGDPLNILNPNGTINAEGQGTFRGKGYSYTGQDRFDARKKVVLDLQALELVDHIEDVTNTIPISDRSKSPIEPYLSEQWFVNMGDRTDGKPGLAQMAMDAVCSDRVKFFPARYASTYLDWLGEKRPWCISRQLWWGHRIPIWYAKCTEADLKKAFGTRKDVAWQRDEINDRWLICGLEDLPANALGKIPIEQDPDVLDTWFSSALWPHSTLGWPEPTADLKYYYPTSTLSTAREIITLWVARMVMTGLYNVGDIPFDHVFIHPTILDGFGVRMSKSKGNGIDPLDIIERYGVDALRFTLTHLTTETQEVRMPVANVCPFCDTLVLQKQEHQEMRTRKLTCPNAECKKVFRPGGPWPEPDPELPTAKQASERFELGRNFANKLWNAARFCLLNLDGYTPGPLNFAELPVEDRWIISRLAGTARTMTAQLEGYEFGNMARTIYEFTWSEFCDWYLEMSKARMGDPKSRPLAQRVLAGVLDGILRLVQPMMPFLAESLWVALNEAAPQRGLPTPTTAGESVVIAAWPDYPESLSDPTVEGRIGRMQMLVRNVREVRNRYMVDSKTALDVAVRCAPAVAEELRTLAPFILSLAGIGKLTCGPDVSKPKQAATTVQPELEAYVSLVGLIDVEAEIARLEKQLAEKRAFADKTRAELENPNFVAKAPADKVQLKRDALAEVEAQIAALEQNLRELRASSSGET
jgi:valyl-tRNA synthetase